MPFFLFFPPSFSSSSSLPLTYAFSYSASLSSHPIFFFPRAPGHGDTLGPSLTRPTMCRLSALPVRAHVLKAFQKENWIPSPVIFLYPGLLYPVSSPPAKISPTLSRAAHGKFLPVLVPPLARMQRRNAVCTKPASGFAGCPLPPHTACFYSRSPSPLQAPEKEKENPAELAERCLRELLGRAAFGNIKNAIKPVLM